MNIPNTQPQPDYWDEDTPWWKAVRKWEQGRNLSSQEIDDLKICSTREDDRRVTQLASLLIRLQHNEMETIQKNDSLTQFLLRRRNAERLKSLLQTEER